MCRCMYNYGIKQSFIYYLEAKLVFHRTSVFSPWGVYGLQNGDCLNTDVC